MIMQIVQPSRQFGRSLEGDLCWDIAYNEDVAQLWWETGPQLDGLGHLGEADTYYNCNHGADFAALTGLTKLGIHTIPPIISRAVLIDMTKHFGVEERAAGVDLRRAGAH